MEENYNKHYVLLDGIGRIIDGWSDGPHFEKGTYGENIVCITEQGEYQFRLFDGGEENPNLFTSSGVPLYKYEDSVVSHRTEEEIAEDEEVLRQEREAEQAIGRAKSEVGATLLLALAQEVPVKVAAKVRSIYGMWQAGTKYGYDGCEKYVQCAIPNTGGTLGTATQLYRCVQPHISQEGWEPYRTQALWVAVDDEHDGTPSDPIPAASGMEYEYGLYYTDATDNNTYLCKRTGEQAGGKVVLQYLPHELVGHYFELVQ